VAETVMTTKGTPRAAWASASPSSELVRPSLEKKKNMPSAVITKGRIIGEMTSAMTRPRPGKRPRAMPSAAMVPSTVATSAAEVPTMKVLRIDSRHALEAKNWSYQRRLQPSMG
jgi:hypothetical protein